MCSDDILEAIQESNTSKAKRFSKLESLLWRAHQVMVFHTPNNPLIEEIEDALS